MKQFFRDYFTFNKRERNGVFVLLTIIILLIVYLNVSENFYKKDPVDFSKFEKEMAALEQQNNSTFSKYENAESPTIESEITYFNFNPNNLPEDDWMKLGLTQKQIKTIKNYEAKGGKFRKKEDVKKIYGISPELYSKLEQYIEFQNEETAVGNKQLANEKNLAVGNEKIIGKDQSTLNNKTQTTNSLIELNTTDSAQLTSIKGIGAFYAKSIVKYKNQLGGFYKKEQLLEIWKFDEEKLNAIEQFIIVDANKIKKININTCIDKELKHPYLTWNMVNAIISFRKNHGNYKTVDEIKKTDLVNEETFRKIEPYITIE